MFAAAHQMLRARLARVAPPVLGALAAALVLAAPASADFGISRFASDFQDTSGAPVTQAGSHADQQVSLEFNVGSDGLMEGSVRNIDVDLPAGFYGNPQTMPTCSMEEILAKDGVCYPAAQVGTLTITETGQDIEYPVYNLEAPDSQTAVLGVLVIGVPAKIVVSVRSGSDFGLTAQLRNINQAISLDTTRLNLWGVPADPIHDAHRYSAYGITGALAGVKPQPFLSMPARCAPLTTTARADSWQNPGAWSTASVTSAPLTGCDRLDFDGTIKSRPQVTTAGTPSGYDVDVNVPQDQSLQGLATPQLRKAVVALPAGTRVSPASAEGLGACSDADLRLNVDNAEPNCPDSSKVGTVSIDTPLLAQPVSGDIILGTQRPDQLLRLFFVARGPGLVIKIPGKVDPDPVTGQLVATFDNTPQLPFTTLHTTFKGGPRAALVNPKACGTYTTHATLTPWSGGPSVEAQDSFTIDKNCDQAGRFEPSLDAGVVDPTGGGSSPFVFSLSRPSGQQDFSSLDVTLPAGLLAHVGDVPLCPEGQAAVGACSAASQVGSVRVGAGAGPSPLAVPQAGKAPSAVFLAGPYRGAPFSLSIVVPAQAGPFDLGTVVVRAALFVDPNTAQVLVRSDPLPTILMGIPLDMQKLTVTMDRPGFMINPTNCAPQQIVAQVGSTGGKSVGLSSSFQATDCAALGFAPKLKIDLTGKGQTTDNKHPALVAHLAPKDGDANLKQAKVILPLSLALDPDNANGLCEPTDAALDKCPAKSIVGTAKAVSVLHEPLSSPVYFVRGERKDPKSGRIIKTLPKLFIPLKGEGVKVNINASSEVPDNKHLVTTFANLPDVPLTSFDLTINGGAHGILVVSGTDICKGNQVATAQFAGQNGRDLEDDITMGTPCKLSVKGSGHGASTAKFTVAGLQPGKVSLSGHGIQKTSRSVSSSTVATLQPRLSAAAKRALSSGRSVTFTVKVTFTSKGAKKAHTVTKKVTLHA